MILITNVEDPTLGEPFAIAVVPGEAPDLANIFHMTAGSRAYIVADADPETIMLALDWAAEVFADDLRHCSRCAKCEFPIMTSHPHKDLICDYCKETS